MINKLILFLAIISGHNLYAQEYQTWIPVVSYHAQYVPVTTTVPVVQYYQTVPIVPTYIYQPIVYEYKPWFRCFRHYNQGYIINQSVPTVTYHYNIVKY